MLPIIIVGGALLSLWLYAVYSAEKPKVYMKNGSKLHRRVRQHMKVLEKVYYPCWWCPFGSPMTLFRQMMRRIPQLPFRREVVELFDGAFCGIDWLEPEGSGPDTPLFVFLPGITSSTHDCSYLLHCVKVVTARGWRSVVVNVRGRGNLRLTTKRSYTGVHTEDFTTVLELIQRRFPKAKKIGCGFSMGGMILWNYLARRTKENVILDAAMVVSSPFNPHDSMVSLERPFNRHVFNRFIARELLDWINDYRDLFCDVVDWSTLQQLTTMREYDTIFTVPVFGYRDCKEYYDDSMLAGKEQKICIPTLTLNAADDVFAPIESMDLSAMASSSEIVCVITAHGGHCAFMDGWNPQKTGLTEEILVQWAATHIQAD